MLFMILVHTLVTYSNHEVMHSGFGWLVGFLGSPPAAPVFMTLMGLSFYYSRNTDLKTGITRGIKIILLGYALNFLRGVLPIFLVQTAAPSIAAGIPAPITNYTDAFVELDILQFAGLALIVMALLREFKVNKYALLAGAIAVAWLSPLLWGKTVHNPVAGHFIDYLWGDKPSTEECIGNLISFPFFPWFSFVLLGMFLGDTLTKSADPKKTFRQMGLAGLILSVPALIYILPHFMYQLGDYYHSRPLMVLFHAGFVLVWMYLCQLAVELLPMNRVFELFFAWSRNVNRIYIIQWVLIMWGADMLLGFNKASYGMTLVIMALMVLGSHYLNEWYLRFTTKKPA